MFRIAEACRIAVAVSVLVSMPAMARSVVILAVANDVQCIVVPARLSTHLSCLRNDRAFDELTASAHE